MENGAKPALIKSHAVHLYLRSDDWGRDWGSKLRLLVLLVPLDEWNAQSIDVEAVFLWKHNSKGEAFTKAVNVSVPPPQWTYI